MVEKRVGYLVLLVLGDEVVHIALCLRELHLVHALTWNKPIRTVVNDLSCNSPPPPRGNIICHRKKKGGNARKKDNRKTDGKKIKYKNKIIIRKGEREKNNFHSRRRKWVLTDI